MKNFNWRFWRYLSAFLITFLLVGLLIFFLPRVEFLYLLVGRYLIPWTKNFGDQSLLVFILAGSVDIIILICAIAFYSIRDHKHKMKSKESLEKAKISVNAKTIIMVGDKK